MNSERSWRTISHVVLALCSLLCLLPFLLLLMSSVSDERTIVRYGYSFFPHAFSLSTYSYLLRQVSTIGLGYFISIATTAVGTVVGTFLMAMFAYPLSRTELRFRRPLSLFVFFAVLFNGGLVPTYLLYTQVLHIKNTVFALLVRGC